MYIYIYMYIYCMYVNNIKVNSVCIPIFLFLYWSRLTIAAESNFHQEIVLFHKKNKNTHFRILHSYSVFVFCIKV